MTFSEILRFSIFLRQQSVAFSNFFSIRFLMLPFFLFGKSRERQKFFINSTDICDAKASFAANANDDNKRHNATHNLGIISFFSKSYYSFNIISPLHIEGSKQRPNIPILHQTHLALFANSCCCRW